jgi:GNAT superfamily N-acetyltransferase
MSTPKPVAALPQGLSLRPANAGDAAFVDQLYRDARPDLLWIDGDEETLRSVQAQQYQVFVQGTGANFPDSIRFIVEKAGGRIGVAVVDFGPNEVRVVFLAMTPEARGFGYGKGVLQGLQQAAWKVRSPLAVVVWHNNPRARSVYLELGFVLDASGAMADRMVWYPQRDPALV